MDFKSLLQSMNSLSEGDVSHRAGPGGYGNRHGSETQTDQYGKPIGKVSLAKMGPKDDTPKKRGRPEDPDKPKTGKDDPKNKKVRDIFGRTTGEVPAGKKGTEHGLSAKEKAAKQADKAAAKKSKKKSSLKEYIEEVESNQQLDESEQSVAEVAPPGAKAERMVKHIKQSYSKDGKLTDVEKAKAYGAAWKAHNKGQVEEAEQVTVAPAQQSTQVIKQGNKVLGSVTNPQLAAQIKQAIGQGQMTLNPNEQEMTEEGEKWIQKAIKHPGALTRKAKAAGQSTQAFAKAHAHDSGTTGKQARLAQTLAKMHESFEAEGVVLTEADLKRTMIKFFDELELGPKGYNIKPAVELRDKVLASAIINKTLAHGRFKSMSGSFKDQMRDAALEHFGFTTYEESLEEADQVPHPSKDLHTTHGMDSKVGDINAFKPSRIQAPSKPVAEPTPWRVDPINAATDRAINFISGLRKPKTKLESTEMKDVQFESWEKELNNLLNEGITVSTSTGQQGAPDSVSINATDNDANELLAILRQSGMGVFGGEEKPNMSPYGVISQGEEEPTGTGTEPQASPAVVGDGDDMLSLIKKMAGIGDDSASQPANSMSVDYEEEGNDDEHECETCGKSPCECDHEEDNQEDEEQTDEGYEKTDEGNPFTEKLKKTPKGGEFKMGDKTYTNTSNLEEDDMEEGNAFGLEVVKAKKDDIPDQHQKIKVGGKEYPVKEGEDTCNECGMYESECGCDEKVEEGFSNDAGGDAMAETELAKLKALLSMGGDLHKMKHNQTVLNPTQVSVKEALNDWKKLSGIK